MSVISGGGLLVRRIRAVDLHHGDRLESRNRFRESTISLVVLEATGGSDMNQDLDLDLIHDDADEE